MHMDDFVQDYNISIAKALELLQACNKPSISYLNGVKHIGDFVRDCSISIAYALELLQTRIKPLISYLYGVCAIFCSTCLVEHVYGYTSWIPGTCKPNWLFCSLLYDNYSDNW